MAYTVEPLNNGHIGTDHFVHYKEVVLFRRQNAFTHVGWCIGKCPLYRGVLYSECPLSEVPLHIQRVSCLSGILPEGYMCRFIQVHTYTHVHACTVEPLIKDTSV